MLLGVEYAWPAIDLDNAVHLFCQWVRGKMQSAESEVYQKHRGRKGSTPSASEIERARSRAWSMCITGKESAGHRRKRPADDATVQRNIAMLTKIRG